MKVQEIVVPKHVGAAILETVEVIIKYVTNAFNHQEVKKIKILNSPYERMKPVRE